MRLLHEVAERRNLLKNLGREHLSPSEIEYCELDKAQALDSFANEVVRLLLKRKVSIPATMKPRQSKYNETPYWGSLYHAIGLGDEANAVKRAELLQQHGFTVIDSVDVFDVTPLAAEALLSGCGSAYPLWLVNHGADALKSLAQLERSGWGRCFCGRITPAHMLLRPYFASRRRDHPDRDVDQYRRLASVTLPLRVADDCCCGCTEKGCEPATGFARGLWADWDLRYLKYVAGSSSIRKHAGDISWVWHDIWLVPVQWEHVCIASLRVFTFEALGLRHTCCSMPGRPRPSVEEIQEIQNEETSALGLLERLVDEFTSKYKEKGEEFTTFLSGHWTQRMESVLTDLEAVKMTQDELRAAEDIGVKWSAVEEESEEDREDDTQLDYWVKELDKITGE